MKSLALPFFVIILVVASILPARAADTPMTAPEDWFSENPAWNKVESIGLAEGAQALQAVAGGAGGAGSILFNDGSKANAPQLHAREYIGDCVVRMEFMLGPGAKVGLYLDGRYKIELSTEVMGAMGPLASVAGSGPIVLPLVNAAGKPGIWQLVEAKLRNARFDDARNKTQEALILEVKIDGKIVQTNTVQTTWSVGTENAWDDAGGRAAVSLDHGSVAIRNFSARRADFSALKVPKVSGQPTNGAKLIDLVAQGEQNFRGFGCIECHAVQRDDLSAKTGPNLYGLFTLEPRDRAIVSGTGAHRFTVKANRAYLQRSVRTPQEELAIGERGPNTGKPYPPVMPTFAPSILSDAQIDGIGAYLSTLNDFSNQGPVVWLAEPTGLENYDPIADRLQLLVDRTVRVQRGPMDHVSARSIHVGQPNGLNYTFDPRLLAIVQVWQGGFLDMSGEWLNRGGLGLKMGFESRQIDLGSSGFLLAPINPRGKLVDFSFKDSIFNDFATMREGLYSTRDHLDRLAEVDAQFFGYSRNSTDLTASPIFRYRVGQNTLSMQTDFAADGEVTIKIDGDFKQAQDFVIGQKALVGLIVSEGELRNDHWLLPAGVHANVLVHGRLSVAEKVWHAKPSTFEYHAQPLVIEASKPTLPPGYSAEAYMGPKDNYGRDQLFEALGIAVAPDGTVVVATRTAGIWRLAKGQWHLFAEGLFDSLGVQVEDEHGLKVVVGQKAELTRVTDTNGDGIADSYETMSDAFTYDGNYHSYMHGPVRAPNGDYFITLNLDAAGKVDFQYNANGTYMGTVGGYRGWAIRVPATGGFEPWASGLRSPAGLGFAPDGRFWYAENQGEYVSTSKLFVMKKGAFYGHPSSLVDRPGMTPDSPEIAWDKVWNERETPAILFPQNRLANSPGNLAWDTTNGKFGPFADQILVGDQTQSLLMRVALETVDGIEQGSVVPFITNLESGVMRPVFLPDHSLLLGETGRGWQAKGGHVASLQHIVWDGRTVPPAIHDVSAVQGGFDLHFTVPIPAGVTTEQLTSSVSARSWVYRDAPDYGSPELDDHDEIISKVEASADRKSLRVLLAKTDQPRIHPQQTARVYHLIVDPKNIWSEPPLGFDAFYTLYKFPAAVK